MPAPTPCPPAISGAPPAEQPEPAPSEPGPCPAAPGACPPSRQAPHRNFSDTYAAFRARFSGSPSNIYVTQPGESPGSPPPPGPPDQVTYAAFNPESGNHPLKLRVKRGSNRPTDSGNDVDLWIRSLLLSTLTASTFNATFAGALNIRIAAPEARTPATASSWTTST